MSSESTLRFILIDAAGPGASPHDTETALARSLQDGTRRVRVRRYTAIVAVAALVGAATIVGSRVLELRNGDPVKPAFSPAPSFSSEGSGANLALYGRYTRHVDGAPGLRFAEGTWKIHFHRDGRVELVYPPNQVDPRRSGDPQPYFSATNDRVRIPGLLFHCDDPGVYEWMALPNGKLYLEPVGDPCSPRRNVLSNGGWRPANEGSRS
jgi:hypothetical protein